MRDGGCRALGGAARRSRPLAGAVRVRVGDALGRSAGNGGGFNSIRGAGHCGVRAGIGVMVAAAVRLPLPVSALLVGMFALFHGYAHGAEMPGSASGLACGLGFVAATAGLHLLGIGPGLLAQRLGSARLVRYAGGAIAACGVYLCLSP